MFSLNNLLKRVLLVTISLNGFGVFQNNAVADPYLTDTSNFKNIHICDVVNSITKQKVKAACGNVNGQPYRVFTDPNNGVVIEQTKDSAGKITSYKTPNFLFAKPCTILQKSTNQKITGTCGIKPDQNGILVNNIIFSDDGYIIEQYERSGTTETIKRTPIVRTSPGTEIGTKDEVIHPYKEFNGKSDNRIGAIEEEGERAEDTRDSKFGLKAVLVGSAFLATLGAIVGVRHILNQKIRVDATPIQEITDPIEEIEKTTKSKNGNKSKQDRTNQSNIPKTITLDSNVPNATSEAAVSVAGQIPQKAVASGMPVFSTPSGQNYIVVQNPNTNLLEALLIMDLGQPHYNGFDYGPNVGSHYSPYIYDIHERVVIDDSRSNSGWNTEPYRSPTELPVAKELEGEGFSTKEVSMAEELKTQPVSDITTPTAESEYVRVSEIVEPTAAEGSDYVKIDDQGVNETPLTAAAEEIEVKAVENDGWGDSNFESGNQDPGASDNSSSSFDSGSSSSFDSGSSSSFDSAGSSSSW